MSKKDYEAIAAILYPLCSHPGAVEGWSALKNAKDQADYFRSTNPRFDKTKFLAACGVKEE